MIERLTRKSKSLDSYVLKDTSAVGCMNGVDKLGEYEDLEEQGLLLRLPCKVGTTVYIIVGKYISKQSIKRITIDSTGMLEFCTKRRGFQLSDFGKTVFLTQAEAEQKLKEMESD